MRFIIIIMLFFLLSGCQSSFGPNALDATHPAYNQAAINTLNQQMLLNLVRLKYRDTPYFLKLNSITASFSFSGSVGADTSLDLGPGGNIVKPSLGISYFDKPTLSLAPLQGEDFLKSILSSLPLEAILVMSQSGWKMERIFGLCVERINDLYNAPSASGPTPSQAPRYRRFKQMLDLLQKLQSSDQIVIGRNQAGIFLYIKTEGISADEIEQLTRLLDLKASSDNKTIGAIQIGSNELQTSPEQITMRTRSMVGLMFYLSQNIDVPEEHRQAGWVTLTKNSDGRLFEWDETPAGGLFKIHSSQSFPKNAFLAVNYRGYWFYIADNDLQSKSTFMLLTQLFELQSGQNQFDGPTLTVPLR